MNAIKLNFINRSNDLNNSKIVIFQKNTSGNYYDPVAWKVIENCGRGDNHQFNFPLEVSISASDSQGNYTQRQIAPAGSVFEMIKDQSGDVLKMSATSADSPNKIEIRNSLDEGFISAYCYRDGRVFALKSVITPYEKAVFSFRPSIWVATGLLIRQGEVMSSGMISNNKVEFSLLGIASASIIMIGGGAGPDSKPLQFMFEDIVYA